jgi:chemotaxis protein MotB
VPDFSVKESKSGGNLDSLWLITFADLMVQLMAFFAIVFSLTQLNTGDASQLIQSLREELGLSRNASSAGDGVLPGADGLEPDRVTTLDKLVADMKTEDPPDEDEGVRLRVVTFRGSILFDEGSSDVKPEFRPWLTRIAQLSHDYAGYHLVLEGHAAPRERGRRNGGDVWALSSERAQAVARSLVSLGVDPTIMIPEFRGDSIVDVDASSPEGRLLARQVRFRFQRAENVTRSQPAVVPEPVSEDSGD